MRSNALQEAEAEALADGVLLPQQDPSAGSAEDIPQTLPMFEEELPTATGLPEPLKDAPVGAPPTATGLPEPLKDAPVGVPEPAKDAPASLPAEAVRMVEMEMPAASVVLSPPCSSFSRSDTKLYLNEKPCEAAAPAPSAGSSAESRVVDIEDTSGLKAGFQRLFSLRAPGFKTS